MSLLMVRRGGGGGSSAPVPMSHGDMRDLRDASGLTAYRSYVIPYQFTRTMPFSSDAYVGPVEHLVLTAASANTFFSSVSSVEFPGDQIEYNIDNILLDSNNIDDANCLYGTITRRITPEGVSFPFDIRGYTTRVFNDAAGETADNTGITFSGIQKVTDGGGAHTALLDTDGHVWCWGHNNFGQCGVDPNITQSVSVPTMVAGLEGVIDIAANGETTTALLNDGTVRVWGYGERGEHGNGANNLYSFTPIQVLGVGGVGFLTGIASLYKGGGGAQHILCVGTNTKVYGWGYNEWGVLGDGNSGVGLVQNTPVIMQDETGLADLSGVSTVSVGGEFSILHMLNGTLKSCGANFRGALGDGTTTDRVLVAAVLVLTDVAHICAGGQHVGAVKTDGTAWMWGNGSYDSLTYDLLGQGSGDNSTVPVQVKGPAGVGFLTGVAQIIADGFKTLFRKTDGTVWATGSQVGGSGGTYCLGDGTQTEAFYPVPVVGPDGNPITTAAMIGTSHNSGVVVLADNKTVVWGNNFEGCVGVSNTIATPPRYRDYADFPLAPYIGQPRRLNSVVMLQSNMTDEFTSPGVTRLTLPTVVFKGNDGAVTVNAVVQKAHALIVENQFNSVSINTDGALYLSAAFHTEIFGQDNLRCTANLSGCLIVTDGSFTINKAQSNKKIIGSDSDLEAELFITGLTDINLTPIPWAGVITLRSANATETLNPIYTDKKMKFIADTGLAVTITGAGSLPTIVVNGDLSDWIEFDQNGFCGGSLNVIKQAMGLV